MSKRHLTNLALCLAVVPLLGWWLTGLFDIDEGFYAAVVAEMNRRGEWITPFYNGQPWFEKPILAYWLAKPMLAIFGDMIGPRLPSVLSAIGCYLLVAWYARRRISEGAAAWSVAILGTSLLFIAVGRMMMTDMPLVLAFSAAMLTFWESLVGNPRWRLLTAGLLGIAVLAKGPVALAFFVLIAGWTYYREPDLRPKFRGQWLLGTLILVAVIGSWYIPVYLANGQTFVQKFSDRAEHRAVHGRRQGALDQGGVDHRALHPGDPGRDVPLVALDMEGVAVRNLPRRGRAGWGSRGTNLRFERQSLGWRPSPRPSPRAGRGGSSPPLPLRVGADRLPVLQRLQREAAALCPAGLGAARDAPGRPLRPQNARWKRR